MAGRVRELLGTYGFEDVLIQIEPTETALQGWVTPQKQPSEADMASL